MKNSLKKNSEGELHEGEGPPRESIWNSGQNDSFPKKKNEKIVGGPEKGGGTAWGEAPRVH